MPEENLGYSIKDIPDTLNPLSTLLEVTQTLEHLK